MRPLGRDFALSPPLLFLSLAATPAVLAAAAAAEAVPAAGTAATATATAATAAATAAAAAVAAAAAERQPAYGRAVRLCACSEAPPAVGFLRRKRKTIQKNFLSPIQHGSSTSGGGGPPRP